MQFTRDRAARPHQGVAPQRHPCRAPASCAFGARALWWWLAVAVEQGGAFWGIVGEVLGGRERGQRPTGRLNSPASRSRHQRRRQEAEEAHEDEEDLMLTETDDQALEAESRADALLDAAYEAGVWRDLQGRREGAASGGLSRRARKRCRC